MAKKYKNITKIDLSGLGLTETGPGKVAVGLGSGTGTTLAVADGGTGQTTYANGEILIGKSSDNSLNKATITVQSPLVIANGNGTIDLQSAHSFNVEGNSGSNRPVGHGNTLEILGGTNITTTVAEGTDTSDDKVTIDFDGTLPVASGGTGATSLTDKAVLISQDSGTDTVGSVAMSTDGKLLIGGTDGPAVNDLTAGDGITSTTGNGTLGLAVDLKSNGGLVIESNKIAVDLGASSFTNTLAQSNIANSTSHTLGIGSIELGHADNTTISRSAEATIAVENKEVITYNDSNNRDITFSNSGSEYPVITIENTNADGNAGKLRFNKNGSSPANDTLGTISFDGEDAGSAAHTYATIIGSIEESTAGNEGGKLQFNIASHDGGLEQGLLIEDGDADAELDVTIANGASSNTTIAGNLTVNGDAATFASSTSYKPQITIKNTTADNKPSQIVFLKNRGGTSTNDADSILSITAEGYDSANNSQDYGNIRFLCNSNTAGSEAGEMYMYVAAGSLLKQAFYALGETSGITGKVGVTLGFGDDSKQTINGLLNIKSEQGSSPSAPSAGNGGYLYTKADGKPYWISDDVSETDLTGGAAAVVFNKVSANQATINSMHTTALELVAAPGSDYMIIPISCVVFVDRNSTVSSSSGLYLGSGTNGSTTSGAGLWSYLKNFMKSEAGDRVYRLRVDANSEMSQGLTDLNNKPLCLKFNNAITNNSLTSMVVHVTYATHYNP
tara:strand:- start:17574 stop:19766 length:2193 start_codon:yes stop_codon:yes gene_type:complete